MKQLQTQRALYLATAGVSLIALVAFIISYSALQQTAATYGFPGWQSWLWPLLIDLPILVFALTSLVIGWLTGHRSIFATSMIVLFSGATVLFNLAHAELHWLNYAVAIMPPLALIVSFEALRELFQIVASHAPAPMSHVAPAEIVAPKPKPMRAKPMPHDTEPPMLQPAEPVIMQHVAEPEIAAIIEQAEEIVALSSLYSEPETAKLWNELETDEARYNYYLEQKTMKLSDEAIAAALGVHRATVDRVKKKMAKVRGTDSNGNGVHA